MYICVYVCYMLYIMSHTVTSWPSPPPDPPWGTPHNPHSTYLHILYICIYYMGYIGTYYTCAQTCWTPRISCFSGVSGVQNGVDFEPIQICHPRSHTPSTPAVLWLHICWCVLIYIHIYHIYIYTHIHILLHHIYTCWPPSSTPHPGCHHLHHQIWGPDMSSTSCYPCYYGMYVCYYTYICANIHTYTPYLHDIQPLSAIPSTMANPWIWGSGSGYGVHQMLYMP